MRNERLDWAYRTYAARVAAYLVRRGAALDDVPDLVGEVFVTAASKFDALPKNDDQLLPWLLVTARNHLSNHVRSAARAQSAHNDLAQSDKVIPDSHDLLVADEDAAEVRWALGQLQDSDRELLLLTAWDELSPQQAAAVLGIHSSTARVRLHRARKRFESTLQSKQDQKKVSELAPSKQSLVVEKS